MKVKYIKRPREFAEAVKAYQEDDTIYVFEKGLRPEIIQHEVGHRELGHIVDPSPSHWVVQELEAEVYTYKKTGMPKRVMTFIQGLQDSLVDAGLSEERSNKIIKGGLRRVWKSLPKIWKEEIKEYIISPFG